MGIKYIGMLFCVNRKTEHFMMTTNLRAISREFDIKYHRLYKVLSDGSVRVEIGECTIYKADVVRGLQRIANVKKEDKFNNIFSEIK